MFSSLRLTSFWRLRCQLHTCLFGKMPPFLPWLYCGPYLVLDRRDKFFRLQLDARTDVVFDLNLGSCLIPSLQLCLRLVDVLLDKFWTLFSAIRCGSCSYPFKGEGYFPSTSCCPFQRNPPRVFCSRRICSTIAPPFLLGGVLCGTMSATPFLSFRTTS